MPSTRVGTRVVGPARRLGFVIAGAAVILAALAVPATAHVTVNPDTAQQGGYGAFTFRVPNEQDKASTTKIVVALPTDTPLASVSVKPVPGWTAQVQEAKLPKPVTTDDGTVTQAPSRITWTAATPASAIQPGQFQEFEISAGPLPKTDRLVFKALQYYSGGDVVRWIDVPTGSTEPAHPAPTVTLTSGGDSAPTTAVTATTAPAVDTGGTSKLTIVALVAGILGLILGVVSLAVSRRQPGPPAGNRRR